MSKKLTPLEAFEILKQDIGACYKEEMLIVEKELKAQEQYVQIAEKEHEDYMLLCGEITRLKNKNKKELKALEIIKEKGVDLFRLKESINVVDYNTDEYVMFYCKELTKEEFELLKEILL